MNLVEGAPKHLVIVHVQWGERDLNPQSHRHSIYSAARYQLRFTSPNVHPKPLSNEEKKMVDRLLCYSEHFCIIYVRFSFLHCLNCFTFKLTTVLPVVQGSNLYLFGAEIENFEIPTQALTAPCSTSELYLLLIRMQ